MSVEPKLYFYEVVGTNTQATEVTLLDFRAKDGSPAIKAGDWSGDRTIQIWNAPQSTSNLAAAPGGSVGAGATGANGFFQASDGISDATAVDLITRDSSPSRGTGIVTGVQLAAAQGGDVVQGTWLNIYNGSSSDGQVTNVAGKQVGYVGANEQKAPLPNVTSGGYITVRMRLQTPGDAVAGDRNFYIRLSYSFR